MSRTARPTSPAGTRGATLHASPRPLSERLLVGHVSDGGISSGRVQPGGVLRALPLPLPLPLPLTLTLPLPLPLRGALVSLSERLRTNTGTLWERSIGPSP